MTTGLLKRLNRDELQGVVAHEIGHIVNQDVKFMTLASVMVGSIILLSHIFLRTMFYTGGRRSSRKTDPRVALVMVGIAILLAILAPIFARMLYFACSRKREYLADASSARFTRFPEGLASALEKISQVHMPTKEVNKAIAPLYIVNPLEGRSLSGLFSTHPPIKERVAILRKMAGAGFIDYQKAYEAVKRAKEPLIDKGTLKASRHLEKREPTKEERKEGIDLALEALRALDKAAGLLLLACPCGMKIKIPPGFKGDSIKCPRCGREHTVPGKHPSSEETGKSQEKKTLTYERKGKGWESFQCECGATISLSPALKAKSVSCPKCRRLVHIVEKGNEEGQEKD